MNLFDTIKKGGPEVLAKILAEKMTDIIKDTSYRRCFQEQSRGEILNFLERHFFNFLMSEGHAEIRGNSLTQSETKFKHFVSGGPQVLAMIIAQEEMTLIFNPSFRGDYSFKTREETRESLERIYLDALMFDIGAARKEEETARRRRRDDAEAAVQRRREKEEEAARRWREEEEAQQRREEDNDDDDVPDFWAEASIIPRVLPSRIRNERPYLDEEW